MNPQSLKPKAQSRLLPPFELADRAIRAIEAVVPIKPQMRTILANLQTGKTKISLTLSGMYTAGRKRLAKDITRALDWSVGSALVSVEITPVRTDGEPVLLLTICLQAPTVGQVSKPVDGSVGQDVPDCRPVRTTGVPASHSSHSFAALSANFRLN